LKYGWIFKIRNTFSEKRFARIRQGALYQGGKTAESRNLIFKTDLFKLHKTIGPEILLLWSLKCHESIGMPLYIDNVSDKTWSVPNREHVTILGLSDTSPLSPSLMVQADSVEEVPRPATSHEFSSVFIAPRGCRRRLDRCWTQEVLHFAPNRNFPSCLLDFVQTDKTPGRATKHTALCRKRKHPRFPEGSAVAVQV